MQVKREIILCLCNADGLRTTCSEQHWASPKASILGSADRAPKVEVLQLVNMILIREQVALVHNISGAHENIFDNFVHIKGSSVIDAIPLMDSSSIPILGTIACNRVSVSH